MADPQHVIDLATAIRTMNELWDIAEGRRGRISDEELLRLRRSYESAEWMLQRLLQRSVGEGTELPPCEILQCDLLQHMKTCGCEGACNEFLNIVERALNG